MYLRGTISLNPKPRTLKGDYMNSKLCDGPAIGAFQAQRIPETLCGQLQPLDILLRVILQGVIILLNRLH